MVQYKSIGLILGASFALWISRSSLKMELNSKLWKFLFVAVFILDIFGDTQFRINAADEKDCYFCEPTTGSKDCMEEPTKSKTCKSKGGFCYMHISDEGVFRRGCVDAGDRFVQKPEDCSNSEKCTVCSDKANCNDKVMKEEKCVVSKYDVDKPTLPSDKPSIICRLALEQLGCYHLEQKSQVEKGCMSSLNKQKRDECKRNNNCEICTSTNCNSKVVRHRDCIQCDDATKANCADPSEAKNVTDCSRFSNSCVVGIDDKGFTHRLCGSNETHNKDRFKNGFEQCNTNDTCNINIFPQDRLKCFQCQGTDECNLKESGAKVKFPAKVCKTYSTNETCYTVFNDGKSYRGCLSEQSEGRTLCDKNGHKCKKCKDMACNDQSAGIRLGDFTNQSIIMFAITILVPYCML